MKYISINQLKSKQQTPQKIIEKVVKINTNDHLSTSKELGLLIEDLEKLREGLLFKDEEIKRDLLKTPCVKITQEFEEFKKQFEEIRFCDTASIRCILEKHERIEEMKLLNKIANILIEILNNKETRVLEKMIDSKDEWKPLCKILSIMRKLELDPETNAIIKSTRKKFENQLLTIFNESYKNKSKLEMKKCYESAYILDKGEFIIKSFIETLPIHNTETMSIGTEFTSFEIESFNDDDLPFVQYLKMIQEAYDNEINEFIYIFFDYEVVIEKITKALFEQSIAEKLGETLNVNDPLIFLVLLDICQAKIHDLVSSIKISFNSCEVDVVMNDLLEPYYSICVFKEKESIDIMFELLVRRKKYKTEFRMNNEPVFTSETQPLNVLSKLINFFYLVTSRGNNLDYEEEQINDLTHHFIKKTNEYVTIICSSYMGADRVELIKMLSDVFLLMKKYFKDSLFFDDFKELVDTRIELIFQNKVEESEAKVKHIISKITYKDMESGINVHISKLVEFIRREAKIAHINFKGQNENTFIMKILSYAYHRLYKKYLSFVYDTNSAKTFKSDVQTIYKLVKELNITTLYDVYDYLYEITEVIHIRKEDIKLYLKAMYHKIPETELKPILKCRTDYHDIKKIMDI